MKEQILKLKSEYPTYGYKKIAKILGCSSSLVKYHLRPEVQKQHRINTQKYRKQNPLKDKAWRFMLRKRKNDFSRIKDGRKAETQKFSLEELQNKLKNNPSCYLSGRPIDLSQSRTYELDHIVPASKGGDNSIGNLGITCVEANRAKSDLSVEELLVLCKDILTTHGYEVKKR
jgi:CRISPR/Cas system Type II protein with McrA/HNH and RuvC-like nuclease domain